MLLHIMGVRFSSSLVHYCTWTYIGLYSVVLGNYFIDFATVMTGYSILGFYPVEVMHSFMFIRT